MAPRNILHMLSPQRHISPFDVNMAVDAGFDAVIPYSGVEVGDVRGLVQDAMFSRPPTSAARTGFFIGGKNAIQALDMLDAGRAAMFPPFEISLFADPAGSFTTAAAMVARVEKELKTRHGQGWSGRMVSVFGGTGVVGYSAAVIAALEGAKVTLVGYDGAERVRKLADAAKARFNVDIASADGSSDALKTAALAQADVVLCAGRAGVEIVGAAHMKGARNLKVVADVNAVPPAGIAGLGAQDDGKPLAGTAAMGIGPFAIGGIKYGVQFGLLQKMTASDKALCLDFRDAYRLARELVR